MTTLETPTAIDTGKRILATDPLYAEVQAFLVDEADLLDEDRYMEWLDLLTTDIAYGMPGRETLYRKDGKGFQSAWGYFEDDAETLRMRARHNTEAPSAWFRNPPTRAHRLINNIAVRTTDKDNEFFVKSSIILFANRFEQHVVDILGAKRQDILRRTDAGLKLAKRTIFVDQAVITQPFGNLFL